MQEFFSHTILTNEQAVSEVAQVEIAMLKAKIKKLEAEIADRKIYKKRIKLNLN